MRVRGIGIFLGKRRGRASVGVCGEGNVVEDDYFVDAEDGEGAREGAGERGFGVVGLGAK